MTKGSRAGGCAGSNYPFLTSYERDNETNLDYAQARYYASTQGRFTGVDRLIASARPLKPQSWNRYAYCINNPLIFVDPSGLIWGTRSNGNGTQTAQWFGTAAEMEEAGFTAMTNFLVRNSNGDGYLSFDRFSNHHEAVSTFAVTNGLFSGVTGLRNAGYTSRSFPLAHLTDPVANTLDAIYRDPKVQGFLNSPEFQFLSIYSGVAAMELTAARAFSSASEATATIPELIFRAGKPNPGNLKPGADGFLSFRDSLSNPFPLRQGQQPVFRFGDDYFGISTSKLPPGSVIPDNIPPGHVSVTGVMPAELKGAVTVRGKLPN